MSRTLIIAEAGVNHNGDMALARRLVLAAAQAGADVVKFQTFVADRLVTKAATKAEYQRSGTDSSESQHEMLSKLELTREMHVELIALCEQCGISFLSTAFDLGSVDLLEEFQPVLTKVPSGELTNIPYLRRVAVPGRRLLLSTGMATTEEIGHAIDVLERAGVCRADITVLHCNTEYPTPVVDVNLRAMATIQNMFHVAVGYSDHTLGIEVATAAVALGATVIEKHVTLDRGLPGPDQSASLEPTEFAAMVHAIRNIELALGDGLKRPSASEIKNILVARKSIVAARPIRVNEIFSELNLTTKRPGTGVAASRWDEYIGKTAQRSYLPDEAIDA
jgi:N,N'-diacetyllegionaminate synthase